MFRNTWKTSTANTEYMNISNYWDLMISFTVHQVYA